MRGTWGAAKADVRSNVRGLVVMTVALALASAAALAALAGARRTDTTIERAAEHFRMGDIDVDLSPDFETGDTSYADAAFERLVSRPYVTGWARASYVLMVPQGFDFSSGPPSILPFVGIDESYGRTVERFELLDGRLARPDAADEAVVSRRFVEVHEVGVGDTFTLQGWPIEQQADLLGGDPGPPPVSHTFTITGIVRTPQEITDSDNEILFGTPAFWTEKAEGLAHFGPGLTLDVDDPERALGDVREVVEAAGGSIERLDLRREEMEPLDRSARVGALALLAFAVLAGGFGAIVVGQTVARQDTRSSAAVSALHALGVTRRQLVAILLVKVVVTTLLALAIGAVGAYLFSDRFPLEVVRGHEPAPGRAFDVVAILAGAVVVASVALLAAVPGTLRSVRAATAPLAAAEARKRPGPFGDLGRRASPAIASGVSMALDGGRGATRTPVRSVLLTAVAGVVAVIGCAAFVRTAEDVATVPARHGWNFDMVLGSEDTSDLTERYVPELEEAPWVAEWSSAAVADVDVDGYGIPLFGFEDGRGSVRPAVIEGRPPASTKEIALGRTDLDRIGASLGDTIRVEAESGQHELTVVGVSVLPSSISAAGGLGHGGFTTLAGVRDLEPDVPVNLFYVRFAEGTQADDVLEQLGPAAAEAAVPDPGEDVKNVERVLGVPVALAVVIALVGAASVAHFLLASVRRRRLDLAVMRTLGFVDRQLLGVSLTQSAVVSVVAVVIGLPGGIVLGRLGWSVIAASLGVSDDLAIPVQPVAAVALGAPVVAATLAAVAGITAIRRHPGEVLRTE